MKCTDGDVAEHRHSESTIYEVLNPNPYDESFNQKKFVQIKVLNILYNDQVCNLVYIKDITSVYIEQER